MYVKLNANGFFTGSYSNLSPFDGSIEVYSLPPMEDYNKSLFYKPTNSVIKEEIKTPIYGELKTIDTQTKQDVVYIEKTVDGVISNIPTILIDGVQTEIDISRVTIIAINPKTGLQVEWDGMDLPIVDYTISYTDKNITTWTFYQTEYDAWVVEQASKPTPKTLEQQVSDLQTENAMLTQHIDDLTNSLVMMTMG